jgi:hypothetical protein
MIIIIKKKPRAKERKRTQFHNMICEIHIFEKVSLIKCKDSKKEITFYSFFFLETLLIVKFMCERKDYFISLIRLTTPF